MSKPSSRYLSRLRPALALGVSAALVAGCSTPDAKPLDRASVERALESPPLETVKVEVSRIRHPLVAPMVIDGRGGFTPEEISAMVVVVSPALRAQRDQRGVAEAQVIQAGILPNPQLGYALDRPHGTYDPAVVAGKSLGLSWEVTSLLTHREQVAAAKADAKALDLSLAWEEWQASRDARLRSYRILSLERRIPRAQSIEDAAADSVAISDRALAKGLSTVSDAAPLTDALAQARGLRLDLEQQLSSERAALNLALGAPPSEHVPIKDPAEAPRAASDSPPTAAALLAGLEDRRLDLVALRYGYESQENSVRSAVLSQFPKIGLSLNKANDTTPIYTRGYGVSVDIPLFDRNQGQVAVAKATRQQLFDEYVARVSEARSLVVEALAEVATARAQLDAVEASLPGLERLAKASEAALKSRNVDEFTVRDARAALENRMIQRELLRQQLLELEVSLEIATGRPELSP